ncbi:MAG: ComF family protein [Clostridia bacterium]|nr:ComF family protein [Clostridia bacterium]
MTNPIYYLLGRLCIFCGRTVEPAGDGICPQCAEELKRDGLILSVSDRRETVSLYRYGGVVRHGLWRFKYRGCAELGRDCGVRLAEAYRMLNDSAHVVTCVPRAKDGLPRLYNQSAVIAKVMAKRLSLPFDGELLFKRNGARPQPLCTSAAMRRHNANYAYRKGPSKRDLTGKTVLLVDDLFTTGATANACVQVLKKSGAAHVLIYTAARSDPSLHKRLVRSLKYRHVTEEFGDCSEFRGRRFRRVR